MDSAPILITLVGLAIALAVFAGAWAARLLLHAAESNKPSRGDSEGNEG